MEILKSFTNKIKRKTSKEETSCNKYIINYTGNLKFEKVKVIAKSRKLENFIRKIKVSLGSRDFEGKNR
jgi:hypothetical protein